MGNEFQVNRYWLERGRTYFQEERLARAYHRLQEEFLLSLLQGSGSSLGRVLELGCGYGRITRLLADRFPGTQIVALDLSPDQLARAADYCAGRGSIRFQPYDFYSGAPFPGEDFDLALAIEVFLHHPATLVRDLVGRLARVARLIVHIDWSEDWRGPVPAHVWLHDYPAFYREIGWACARFVLPEKADGKQQILFAAARQLPDGITRMEREGIRLAAGAASPGPSAEDGGLREWDRRVQRAWEDLCGVVPEGGEVILVDGAEWGMPGMWQGRRVVPFTERAGQYWGPPVGDEAAWVEVQRLRGAGATHLAIPWNAFAWREWYPEWHRRLRAQYACLLENERLVVWDLRSAAPGRHVPEH